MLSVTLITDQVSVFQDSLSSAQQWSPYTVMQECYEILEFRHAIR